MVRGDDVLADELRQVSRHALRHAPRVDENERGAMLASELGKARVDLLPDLARHDRFERRRRKLEREVARAYVSGVDDGATLGRRSSAHEIARDFLDRLLRGRQADAHRRRRGQCSETLQRQREVAPALVRRERVNFVDDHRARRREHPAPGIRAEQYVERFRGRDDNMRRPAAHARALALRRVAGADQRADFDIRITQRCKLCADARQRSFEIAPDVVGERLQWRNVDDGRFIRQCAFDAPAHQSIDRRKEGSERLSRSGRRGDEDMAAGLDRGPRPRLRLGRRGKGLAKPGLDGGVEHCRLGHRPNIIAGDACCKMLTEIGFVAQEARSAKGRTASYQRALVFGRRCGKVGCKLLRDRSSSSCSHRRNAASGGQSRKLGGYTR